MPRARTAPQTPVDRCDHYLQALARVLTERRGNRQLVLARCDIWLDERLRHQTPTPPATTT